nr:hypothetical protein [uncultured Acinetobacter sp.]
MPRTILISTEPKLQDIYKNYELIEVIEMPASYIQDEYQSNDYKVKIKSNSNECELLAGKKEEFNDAYKWGVNVVSGDIETFKSLLNHEKVRFIED